MKIIIIGGSGFIGSKISYELLRQGDSVVVVDLVPPKISGVAFVKGSYEQEIPKNSLLLKPDIVINLAGRSIMGPWNSEHKKAIYNTRVFTTKNLIQSFKDPQLRPLVFIQASATGFYGNRGEETLSEGSPAEENTYLATVASEWEKEGALAQKYGIRTVIVRQGNVLGELGLLQALKPIYSLGFGGPVGSGENWFPWIHIDDLVRIYIAIIKQTQFTGILNAVAPEVVRYKDFSSSIADALHRPHILRVPRLLFRMKYRGFTDEITSSQKVVSLRMWELGHILKHKTLVEALKDIYK